MKKTLSSILGLLCVGGIFLACGQNADGSANLLWTLSCVLVSVLSGWAFCKLNPELGKEACDE